MATAMWPVTAPCGASPRCCAPPLAPTPSSADSAARSLPSCCRPHAAAGPALLRSRRRRPGARRPGCPPRRAQHRGVRAGLRAQLAALAHHEPSALHPAHEAMAAGVATAAATQATAAARARESGGTALASAAPPAQPTILRLAEPRRPSVDELPAITASFGIAHLAPARCPTPTPHACSATPTPPSMPPSAPVATDPPPGR